MVKILVSPSCASCRKVRKWFDENKIEYEAVNIFSPSLTADDVKEAITKSENGTDDIISRRSKVFQDSNVDFDELTVSELINFVLKNPRSLSGRSSSTTTASKSVITQKRFALSFLGRDASRPWLARNARSTGPAITKRNKKMRKSCAFSLQKAAYFPMALIARRVLETLEKEQGMPLSSSNVPRILFAPSRLLNSNSTS